MPDYPAKETKRERLDRLYAQLDIERSSFISHWRDIGDHLLPMRQRFQITDNNRGERKNQKIIRNVAGIALRTLKAGMMAGLTSPARPWFRLTVADPAMAEYGPVKIWLETVTNRMRDIFTRSNLYNVLPIGYGDIGAFGTSAMGIVRDLQSFLRCYSYPIGSYWLALNDRLQVDTFVREFRMTTRQLIGRFGGRDGQPLAPGQKPQWGNFSVSVRNQWDAGNYEQWHDIRHAVTPNAGYDPRRALSKYKLFSSCYYEVANQEKEDHFLREAGYDMFPILAPRWEVGGEDVYGTSCPGMEALGDIKELQFAAKRKKNAIDLLVRPPMMAPTHMRNQKTSILAGDVTYVDVREGMQGFKPVREVDPKLKDLTDDIKEIEIIIQQAFFSDLFRRLLDDYRAQRPTATEIRAIEEEKLLAMGPVLEQLNQDEFDPLIDLTFAFMLEESARTPDDPIIPIPPEPLQGQPLKVEYISIMAQAQKAVGVAGIERTAAFVRGLAESNPPALDNFDDDTAIGLYGEMTGVSPKIIRPYEDVRAIREARAAQQEAERKAAMAEMAAKTAKDLAGADMTGENALTRIEDQAQAREAIPA